MKSTLVSKRLPALLGGIASAATLVFVLSAQAQTPPVGLGGCAAGPALPCSGPAGCGAVFASSTTLATPANNRCAKAAATQPCAAAGCSGHATVCGSCWW